MTIPIRCYMVFSISASNIHKLQCCANMAACLILQQSLTPAQYLLEWLPISTWVDFLIHRFQSIQNAAARLVFGLHRSKHVSDSLVSLHWLRVTERIVFKVAVQTYRALHADALLYLRQFTRTYRCHAVSIKTRCHAIAKTTARCAQ